jgi:hypothetical protein
MSSQNMRTNIYIYVQHTVLTMHIPSYGTHEVGEFSLKCDSVLSI